MILQTTQENTLQKYTAVFTIHTYASDKIVCADPGLP